MSASRSYDRIGTGYAATRRADPRLADLISQALGEASRVVNVGAGTGSYEPDDRRVVAVEPSERMARQRPLGAAPMVRADAEALPFRAGSFEAGMALLTIHHWSDKLAGLLELSRVATRRIVLLTWDAWHPASESFWLVRDYFPEFVSVDRERFPSIEELQGLLHDAHVIPVLIPHDCVDGFLGAYWRRPAAYLREELRAGISSFATCRDLSALRRLEHDLASGAWQARNGELLARDELDLGYRLVVGRPPEQL